MGTYITGDRDIEDIPSLTAKALRINLNKHIYGTFSEIGAGQETVRYFFRAGGASGTIAKAVSAYDRTSVMLSMELSRMDDMLLKLV